MLRMEDIAPSFQRHGLQVFLEPLLKRNVREHLKVTCTEETKTNKQIDIDTLLRFDEKDVSGLGVGTALHRRRLIRWIRIQRQKRTDIRSYRYYYMILLVLGCLLATIFSILYAENSKGDAATTESSAEQQQDNPFEVYRESASELKLQKWVPSLTKGQLKSRMDRFAKDIEGVHSSGSLDEIFESIENVAWKAPTESDCASSMYNLYTSMNSVLQQVERSSDVQFPEPWIWELKFRMYRALENVVDVFPASLMAWEKIASHIDMYFAENKTMLSRAIESLERVLTMDAKRATAWLQLSKLEMRVGNITAALECLRALAPLLPKSSIVEDTEDHEMRRKLLMNVDMKLMGDVLTQMCMGGGEDIDDRDQDHITMGSRGWACEQTNQNERAVSYYEHALRRASETEGSRHYIQLAQYHMKQNRLDDAERLFREAVRVEPSSAHAQYALGTFLGENRQKQEFQAWPFLLRATKLDKFKPDHFFNLAIVSSRIATTLRNNPKLKVQPEVDFLDVATKSYNNVMTLEKQQGQEFEMASKQVTTLDSSSENWKGVTNARSLVRKWGKVPPTSMDKKAAACACNLAVLYYAIGNHDMSFRNFKSCIANPKYDTLYAGAMMHLFELMGQDTSRHAVRFRDMSLSSGSNTIELQRCQSVLSMPCREPCNQSERNPFYHIRSYRAERADLLPDLVNAIERAAQARGGWTTKRHAAYPTTDIPLEEAPELLPWFLQLRSNLIVPVIRRDYNVNVEGFHDIFLIKYEAKDGSQDHLDYHRDSSLLSFTMLLNDPSEFEGGGTKFKGLNDTVLQHEVGMLTIHCGQLLHGGQKITSGKRYIMAGFISISSPNLNADVVLESKTIRANNHDIPDEFYLETLFDKIESTRT